MGDMGDTFRAFGEYKAGEKAKIEPSRFEYAVDKLMEAGHRVGRDPKDERVIMINGYIRLWPYTGWWSGKGIGSDRGIHNLLEKLEQVTTAASPDLSQTKLDKNVISKSNPEGFVTEIVVTIEKPKA